MIEYHNKGEEEICEIILTFDDGPNPQTTPKLLDFFKKNNIKVLFFVVGKKLITEYGLSLVRRAYKEGHIIGNHTFSHTNLIKLTKPHIRSEIYLTHELICSCTGTCKYFRPPYGSINREVKQVIGELGYTHVLWNVNTMDWKYKDNCSWIHHGIKQLNRYGKNIILMHDIHPTTVDNISYFIYRLKSLSNTIFSLNIGSDKMPSSSS